MRNLAELVLDRAEQRPRARFGVSDAPMALAEAVATARSVSGALQASGLGPGSRVAMIGESSSSYLVAWLALQLLGAEAALVNPTYPDELVARMLDDLAPDAVASLGERGALPRTGVPRLDLSGAAEGRVLVDGVTASGAADGAPPGLQRAPLDLAGFMHTSGTTGTPKFCAQTHEYFLRLGRFIADTMCLSARDTVFAPLPLFHINPLGYGVIGGLTGRSDILAASRFSARGFWPTVREAGVTALILHAPPVEILKRATGPTDSAGHQVRIVFYADADFLERFDVPPRGLGLRLHGGRRPLPRVALATGRAARSARGDRSVRRPAPARRRVAGRRGRGDPRAGRATGACCSPGTRRARSCSRHSTPTGGSPPVTWGGSTPTGTSSSSSAGRSPSGSRASSCPIGFVEQQFAAVDGIDDLAVWRRQSELVDDQVVLHVVSDNVPLDGIRAVASTLPGFMQPSCVVRVTHIPRDTGVGKVRRRELAHVAALEVHEL